VDGCGWRCGDVGAGVGLAFSPKRGLGLTIRSNVTRITVIKCRWQIQRLQTHFAF
jgi:hypothetical protein